MTIGTPEGWTSYVVRMPADLHAAIKTKAAAEKRSMANAIRDALRRYVETP